MFDSGILASRLIEEIQEEADIAIPILDGTYVSWLNALEQLLYSEIIKEQKKSKIDLTRFLADLAVAHPEMKLNLWPLFDSQRSGEAVLSVLDDGSYTVRIEHTSNATSEGQIFTQKVTLRQGTYTLSDNAQAFSGGMPATLRRIYVSNASTGTVLAGLSFQSTPGASTTFTLGEDTDVILGIRVLENYDYGADGYTFWPQLEVGSTKTASFIPPARTALTSDIPVILCSLPEPSSEAPVRFEDIQAVYADSTQMIKSTLASGPLFPDTYFKDENKLGVHFTKLPNDLFIIYSVRPKLKTETNMHSTNVMLPAEFIDLARAKLRGEAYKLANEPGLAAVWLNDYNVLLETFKAWLATKQASFGM